MVQGIITYNIHKRKEVGQARVSFKWRMDKENVYIQQKNIPPLRRMIIIHVTVWTNLENVRVKRPVMKGPYSKRLQYENVGRSRLEVKASERKERRRCDSL